ncbi:outer membrane protein assembly factor BamA [Reinekea marina]|uniref:Outer membrane protein assembly factor BamA n=2 Tax=Reinekea marina TaxID=1310421 RepID=A0ABV7WM10_9GAMM
MAVAFLLSAQAVGAATFKVDGIEVVGLQRVSLGSVLSVLTVREGDVVEEQDANRWLREAYKTGYFYNVELSREDNRLIFEVTERPAIEKVSFDGLKSIPTESFEAVLKDVGLAEGEIYNPALLENIQLELEKQYGVQGRYNAVVESTVTPLTRNRVNIDLAIEEGPVAKIAYIHFLGNELYSDEELARALQLQKSGSSLWHFVNKRNHYSSAALAGDKQRLEDFYFDRGHLSYQLDSNQVSISENKSDISMAFNITEGPIFSISDVELTGDLLHLGAELEQAVTLTSGQVYSRKDVSLVVRNLTELLSEEGYAFASVRDGFELNTENNTVKVTINVQPNSLVYVNRILIQGNIATNDEVIRRELRQLEGALVINNNIRASKARLERLGYFTNVSIQTQRITGRTDLVDLVVRVAEAKDSQINIAGGYAGGSGFYGEFSLKQTNFMGRGVDFSATLNANKTTQNYSISVDNPYFTLDGVSLGADLYYRHSDYSDTTFGTYATNAAGGRVTLGYPLSENQRVSYGIGLANEELFLSDTLATQEMLDFRETNGDVYSNVTTKFGWNYNTLNGSIKADKGRFASANIEVAVPPGDLSYFRSTFNAQQFVHFDKNLALRFHTDLGYGGGLGDSGLLPFYKNFYAGGSRSVRGYQQGGLGPLGTPQTDESGTELTEPSPIGGNIKVEYGVGLIIPTPIVSNQNAYRTSLFIDAGNVFTDQCATTNTRCESGILWDEIRYSAGVDFTWITPIAPLSFSYAWPLNNKPDDYVTNFSFNIGISY